MLTWIQIEPFLRERIDAQRLKLEGRLDHDETEFVRGKLAAFKEVLGLPEKTDLVKNPLGDEWGQPLTAVDIKPWAAGRRNEQ